MSRGNSVDNLIVLESPGKINAISSYLSKVFDNFIVKASYGHVSDLPKSKLGFDPDNNFKADYNVTRDKVKVVRELKSHIGKNTILWLATDGDREGEKIAEAVAEVLQMPADRIRRVIFHSISKDAVLQAVANPITIDKNLADAATARRVLDRAVGYKLSPLLWVKIKFGLSAGRLQSIALRIIADREKLINDFIPDEFWKLKLLVKYNNSEFRAELSKIDGKKAIVKDGNTANSIKQECDANKYILENVIEKSTLRNPPPPFTTSTLQQIASSKINFGVKKTMDVAQKLYEGSIRIPNHTGGLITYMRTDSINLAAPAIQAAKATIANEYGKDYLNPNTRVYNTKSKGAQEAHEAIRPVDFNITPDSISRYLSTDEYKLYKLIWSRAIATQMAPAKVANTTYAVSAGSGKEYIYEAKGTKILFPGYLKAYNTDNNKDNKLLPYVPKGALLDNTKLTTEQNYTKPPSRYSEATLVKKLETEGIGRPSTYASTISTILTRGYIVRTKDKKLEPTMIGTTVSNYLVSNFPNIMDFKFTSNMETELDKIAEGKLKWQDMMGNFYFDFIKAIKSKEGGDRVQFSEARVLGKYKDTGLDISVRAGQYGSYIQVGNSGKQDDGTKIKPYKISPIPKGVQIDSVTLEDAMYYLQVPRVLGKDIKVGIGRFGAYIQANGSYYSIKKNDEYDAYTITLEQALLLIQAIDDEKAKNLLWSNKCGIHGDIDIINGKYGFYLYRKGNGKLPKGNFKLPKELKDDRAAIDKLTVKEVTSILDKQSITSNKKKRKRYTK